MRGFPSAVQTEIKRGRNEQKHARIRTRTRKCGRAFNGCVNLVDKVRTQKMIVADEPSSSTARHRDEACSSGLVDEYLQWIRFYQQQTQLPVVIPSQPIPSHLVSRLAYWLTSATLLIDFSRTVSQCPSGKSEYLHRSVVGVMLRAEQQAPLDLLPLQHCKAL